MQSEDLCFSSAVEKLADPQPPTPEKVHFVPLNFSAFCLCLPTPITPPFSVPQTNLEEYNTLRMKLVEGTEALPRVKVQTPTLPKPSLNLSSFKITQDNGSATDLPKLKRKRRSKAGFSRRRAFDRRADVVLKTILRATKKLCFNDFC